MRTTLLAVFFIINSVLQAQQRQCTGMPGLTATNFAPVAGDAFLSGINDNTPTGVIRIPVVVHVLYETDAQNISEAQIKSGIAALNRDFRRRNSDTTKTPARFKALAADTEIEFALAITDPRGVATNGIVRKRTTVKEWTLDDKIKFSKHGGNDAWDPTKYMNIWIGHMPRSLGYSSMPGDAAAVDGVVITTSAFGTIGKTGAYNMGRTLVHETGHWLGLRHIWGDDLCGDDGIADTPPQAGFTSGCPSYFLSSCNNGALGDMYMNYMDFTADACMNLFTLGQKAKMRSLFARGGLRHSLLSGAGLLPPTVEEAPVVNTPIVAVPPRQNTSPVNNPDPVAAAKLYPVPAGDWVMLQLPDAGWIGKELQVLNLNGSVVKRIIVTSLQQKIILQGLPKGIYLLQGQHQGHRLVEKLVKG